MEVNGSQKTTKERSQVISIIAWVSIIISLYAIVAKLQVTMHDFQVLQNRGNIPLPLLAIMALFMLAVLLLPVAFSIGVLLRKNWGRLGIMLVSLIVIGLNFHYMYLAKIFYPQQMLGIIFYLVLFMTLKTEKYKKEFLVDNS